MENIVNVPAHVVRATGNIPLIVSGLATHRDGHIEVKIEDDASGLHIGSQVIISFHDMDLPKVIANVVGNNVGVITCTPKVVKEPERRYYPRLFGGIQLRYKVLRGQDASEVAARWIAHGTTKDSSQWLSPDEFMNFSVTGLAFDTTTGTTADDLLLLDLSFRRKPERFRATGRVVRVLPIPEDERDPEIQVGGEPVSQRVAIDFQELPSGARAELVAMTLAIQEAMI